MYSDLFDQLGRGRSSSSAASEVATLESPALVSFKAGKMSLTRMVSTDPSSSSDLPKFHCVADPARGEVRLVHHSSSAAATSNLPPQLQWQWYDRRQERVEEIVTVETAKSTFERIELPALKHHQHDRVYVWTLPVTTTATATTSSTTATGSSSSNDDGGDTTVEYKMYWMQDEDPSKDDEIVATVNQYLAKVGETTAATNTTSTNSATLRMPSSNNNNISQVDALSSILENLGMPQSETTAISTGATSDPTTSTTGAAAVSTTMNQLTLADLQGAMAGIQQQQQQHSMPGPALSDVVTQSAIDALMADDGARRRLVVLLPEGQQTEEHLRENLQSAPLQQTLRALTQTLWPSSSDENLPNNDWSGYASVVANFQLAEEHNSGVNGTAVAQQQQHQQHPGNPIQAFLDSIVATVEKEQREEEENKVDDNDNDDEVLPE